MLWILAVLFLTIIWIMRDRWNNRRLIALAEQLAPRSIALPFVGHAYRFLGDDEDRMETFKKIGYEAMEKGGLISHWQGNKLYVLVADAGDAEVLLKTCLEKDDVMKFFRVLLGNGSVFAPVSIWRPRRKMLAPTFSPKNLNSFVNVFSDQSSSMVEQLRSVAGQGAFSIWKYLTAYTMDSVCETALGIKMNSQLQPDQPFLHAFENCCRLDAKRICQPWLYNDKVYRFFCTNDSELHAYSKELIWNFMNKIISTKGEELKKQKMDQDISATKKESWKTFLELLMESSVEYNNVTLREETLVIVLAGTDTSAVGSAFTTVMMAKYPDVQDKVYQELQDVFGDSDRPVTPEDLPRLKYLEAVIKETLRMYPPVPFIVRKVEKDVTLPSGITLVEGCGLFISIWSIHRNPRYWGADAEQFRPERFLDAPPTHPAAFMPFSHGPRSCLGYQYAMMSMKTALATMLRRHRVLPNETNDNVSQDKLHSTDGTKRDELRVKFDVMMRDVNNFVVQLELR
uniref:Cytochrome P450 n=1 Tax=Heliothis virescens TaxID=7102 RepID=A0A2A4JGQ9_HELVI